CSMPEKPENGNFYFTTKRENKIGGFVKFTCDPGFDLNGQKQIKCLKSTKNWATEFPTCEIGVRCPTIPTTLLNGFVQIEPGEMVVGKQVTFTCRRGYYLPKFSQRLIECQQDGTWTDDVPECVKSGCQLPEVDIENGFVIDARNGTYLANDPLYYGCDDGYKIRGSWQVCKPSKGTSGKWDGDVPRCE
ncbi:sushi, von Willebrand factor type A, EGF and pentraxin domain-containing protein 1-like, partial [Anneissia japonica]|uniref:sushi, von Willebrand factor type A, EGF and pentraxin domain-containing protein 1-like n=1 Tax=Anneissia japonica TaxID=1529436 RepID=UPI0014257C0D